MKKSVLLILLFCLNHVWGHWSHCGTGFVITNQAMSLVGSTQAGAKVFLLRKYHTHSLIVCLEECCSRKYGLCSVAEYKNHSRNANCFQYSCQPIHKCKFMDSEGTDSFTFPIDTRNHSSTSNAIKSDNNKVKDIKESVSIHHPQQRTFKDHARAVTARKGVELFSTATNNEGSLASPKEVATTHLENGDSSESLSYTFKDHTQTVVARKGVESSAVDKDSSSSWEGFSGTYLGNGLSSKSYDAVTVLGVLSKTDSSLKNDNTTIKPRKGVDSEAESVSVKIKARKGVEVLYSSKSTDAPEVSRSKVKPRKGVAPLLYSVTTAPIMNVADSLGTLSELSSTTTDTNTTNVSRSLPSPLTLSTDLISVLEQVFRDESPSPSSSSKFHYSTKTVGSNSFTVASTPVSSVKHDEHTTLPLSSAVTDPSSKSGVTELPMMPFHTVLPSISLGHHEKVLESTPSLATVTEQRPVSSSHLSAQIQNTSQAPLLQTSMNSHYIISNDDGLHNHDNSVLMFPISSPNKTQMLVLSSVDDSESERKYKSSMHLVLSLVFGLLVLFVVFGAVAKRVYDVWMRRHYHRMDFLIDGMYDGYS